MLTVGISPMTERPELWDHTTDPQAVAGGSREGVGAESYCRQWVAAQLVT